MLRLLFLYIASIYSLYVKAQILSNFPDLNLTTTITYKDGLPPPGTIVNLVKDKRGFLWTSGQTGLYCYLGYGFEKLTISRNPTEQALFDKYCYNTVAVGDSCFWTSGLEGCMFVNYYTRKYVRFPNNYFNNSLQYGSIITFDAFTALIFMKDSVARLHANGTIEKLPFHKNNVSAVFKDQNGRLWSSPFRGKVISRLNKSITAFDSTVQFLATNQMAFTDQNRKMWAISWGTGLRVLNLITSKQDSLKDYSRKIFNSLTTCHFNNREYILTSGDEGLVLTDKNTMEHHRYSIKTRSGNTHLRIIYKNPDNNDIWFCSDEGIGKLSQKQSIETIFTNRLFKASRNYYEQDTYSIEYYSEIDDRKYLGLYYMGGMAILNEKNELVKYIKSISPDFSFQSRQINSVAKDKKGNYWVASDAGLQLCDSLLHVTRNFVTDQISFFDNRYYFKEVHMVNDSILLIRQNRSFTLFNTYSHKFLLHNYAPDIIPKQYTGITNDFINQMWFTGNLESIWYATEKGIFRYNVMTNEITKTITPNSFVENMTHDKQGNIWAGTVQGIVKVDTATGELTYVNGLPGAYTSYIYRICTDSSGRIWSSSPQEITGYDPLTKRFVHLSMNNGYLDQTPGGIIETTANGNICAGFTNGFYYFNPDDFFEKKHTTQIQNVTAADSSYLWQYHSGNKHIRFPHDIGRINISFASPQYYSEKSNDYYYRIVQIDTTWKYLNKGEVTLLNAAPGYYTVEVSNIAYASDSEKDILYIKIMPPYYQTWWFYLLCIIAILALASYFMLGRIKRIRLRANLNRITIEKQKTEAEFKQKLADTELALLHSQMNPHFIFNCLNSIKLYVEENNTEAASFYLGKFSSLIRSVLEMSGEEKILLENEIKSITLYLEMEAMRFKEKLKYTIHIEDNVDVDFIQIPPLLIQPYIENAIWHGLMPKESGGHVRITISQAEDILTIIVEDNGIGRAQARQLKSKTALKHKSFGMKLTEERINITNLTYKTGATVEVKDLTDNSGKASGTRITIKLPI